MKTLTLTALMLIIAIFNTDAQNTFDTLRFPSINGGYDEILKGGDGTGEWRFNSRYDDIVFNAGYAQNAPRTLFFKISGAEAMKIDQHGVKLSDTTSLQFPSSISGYNAIGAGITGEWLFKSRYDDIVMEAGLDVNNPKAFRFKVGGFEKMKIDTLGVNITSASSIGFPSINGGSNLISSDGTGEWLFKSRYDNLTLDAGLVTGTPRILFFKIGGNEKLNIDQHGSTFTGKVGIDVVNSERIGNYRLYVKHGIMTEKVKVAVANSGEWADYVFAEDYPLKSLEEVEKFIKTNQHLPNIPSAEDVVKEGINVAEMDAKLLEKIEELTLYIIAIEKRMKVLENSNNN